MANRTFDRTVLNQRERPLSSDLNQAQSELDMTERRIADLMTRRRNGTFFVSDANEGRFISDGFHIFPLGTNFLGLRAGMGFQPNGADLPLAIGGVLGVNDPYITKPLILDGDITIGPVPPNPGAARIDIVEVRYNRRLEDVASRDILDPGTGVFSPGLVNKTLAFVLDATMFTTNGAGAINYKTGVSGAGVPPATTAGYLKLCEINVPAAYVAAAITTSLLNDTRRIAGISVAGGLSWVHPLVAGPPTLLRCAAMPTCGAAVQWLAADVGAVYLWCGDNAVISGCSMTAGGSSTTATSRFASFDTALPPTSLIIGAGDQTIVNTDPNTARTTSIAIGQRAIKFFFRIAQGAGFVAPTVVATPMSLNFNMAFE